MEVRPALREAVWPEGRAILQPRAMQALVTLARADGAVVSRDQLVAECWGGRTVGNDAIHRVLHLLRQLSENSHGAGFAIQTVARVGYRLVAASPDAVPPARPLLGAPLLAVLAFDDLTDDPELGYFTDGVSEEILHAVSRTVRVVGRSSSFALRGRDKSAAKVAELLGATHMLDGSVRRGRDRVRVSAELAETATQTNLWSGHFDRPLTDVLALQDDIASSVAAALDLAFSRTPDLGPIDPVAFDLYLRARDPGQSQFLPDIELLEQATARAPNLAAAWALLAYSRALRVRWADAAPARIAEVEDAARKALELDPNASHAYLALASIEPICGAFARQRELSAKAFAAAPQDMVVLNHVCGLNDVVGFQRRALALVAQAYVTDPRGAGWYYAYMLDAVGRTAEANELCDRDLARFPPIGALVAVAMRAAAEAGDWSRYDQLAARAPRDVLAAPIMVMVSDLAQRLRNWTPAISDQMLAHLRREATENDRALLIWAGLIAARGRADEVWAILDGVSFKALFTPQGSLAIGELGLNVLFSPTCRRLREDPRFVGLCARLGLVEFWSEAGEWPDCVTEVAPFYDFRAEACRHLAANS